MSPESESTAKAPEKRKGMPEQGGMLSAIYGLAFLGGAVYYIQNAQSFWQGLLGVLKALLWPGVLMYKILEALKM